MLLFPFSIYLLLFLSPFIIIPILHAFSKLMGIIWTGIVAPKSVPISTLFF